MAGNPSEEKTHGGWEFVSVCFDFAPSFKLQGIHQKKTWGHEKTHGVLGIEANHSKITSYCPRMNRPVLLNSGGRCCSKSAPNPRDSHENLGVSDTPKRWCSPEKGVPTQKKAHPIDRFQSYRFQSFSSIKPAEVHSKMATNSNKNTSHPLVG